MQLIEKNEIEVSPFSSEQIEALYKICPSHLKRMSKDLICVILTGFIQQIREARQELSKGGSVDIPSTIPLSECMPFDELHSLLREFRVNSTFVNQHLIMSKYGQDKPEKGYVYVAKFDDGHIKIGCTLYPARRLKQISRGNQAKIIDSWVSQSCVNYMDIEKSAHEKFKTFRTNNEFFKTDMKEVSEWIVKRIEA